MRMIASSAEDAWHALRQPGAYEWWYFDALSDDQEYGLVAIWFCGMPFSPDYNSHIDRHRRHPESVPPPDPCDYGAFSFALYHRGRTIAYSLVEYDADDFAASTAHPEVRTGRNRFTYDSDTATYRLVVDVPLTEVTTGIPVALGRRLTGSFAFQNRTPNWLSDADADRLNRPGRASATHTWNLVAPVCAVRGAATLFAPDGETEREVAFTGRGYHDHNFDTEPMSRAINRWHWGRCWTGDRMLVYYATEPFRGAGAPFNCGILFDDAEPRVVTDRLDVTFPSQRRNWLALKYPDCLRLRLPEDAGEAGEWVVRKRHMVDSGPFYVRFLSELDGSSGAAHGVSETLDGTRLRPRFLRPMINTRIHRPESRRRALPAPLARLSRTALAWLVS